MSCPRCSENSVEPPTLYTYFLDSDGDGFGDPNNSIESSKQPSGYVMDNTDYNDADATIHSTSTIITMLPDFSFVVPNATYGSLNLYLKFKLYSYVEGKYMFELENYLVKESTGDALSVGSDLSLILPHVRYEPLGFWMKLKFYGNIDGKLIWELDSYHGIGNLM
jgi:hypothetical protein